MNHASDSAPLERTRAKAQAAGAKWYFTGKPCRSGHVCSRYAVSGQCLECSRLQVKRYDERDRAERATAARERRRQNVEVARARLKAWQQANPDIMRAGTIRRRARQAGAEGSHTAADVAALLAAQRGGCGYCGVSIRKGYEVDHIIPLSKGGSNWPRNLILACAPCNRRKGASDPLVFAAREGRLT